MGADKGMGIAISGLAGGMAIGMLNPILGASIAVPSLIALGIDAWPKNKQNKEFNFELFFQSIGFKNNLEHVPKLLNKVKTDFSEKYYFSLPYGLSVSDLVKHQEALEQALNKNALVRYANHTIEIEVVEKKLEEKYNFINHPLKDKKSIRFHIGESLTGPVEVNLKSDPHILLGGTTNSGKSVTLRTILTDLVLNYKPHELQYYLIDLKGGVEMGLFEELKHTKAFTMNPDKVYPILNELYKETQRRAQLFKEVKATNLETYTKITGKKLPFKLLVIEEFVLLSSNKYKKTTELLYTLLAQARAFGIHILLTCQRACSKTVDTRLRALLNTRIVLKVEDKTNSDIMLDRSGAEQLRGAGHGLLKHNAKLTEFQAYFLTEEQVQKCIEPYLEPKKVPKEIDEAKGIKESIKNNAQEPQRATEKDLVNKVISEPFKKEIKASNETVIGKVNDLSFLDKI
jgi:DNA segregation ATPase FtsK/SpoIIIE, S-DNA-T family